MRRDYPLRVAGMVLAVLALQTLSLEAQKPPADFEIDAIRGVAELSCRFRYPEKAVDQVIQGGEVELVVTTKSAAGDVVYQLTNAAYAHTNPAITDQAPPPIRMLRPPVQFRSYQDSGHREVREYLLLLAIDVAAPPRHHDVELTFSAPDKRDETRLIRLFVGAHARDKYVDGSPTTPVPRVTAASTSPISVTIKNQYPTYRLRVREINVWSDPQGLVEPRSLSEDIEIPPGQSKAIEFEVTGGRSWLRHLSPVESKAHLNVHIVYEDGYRTGIERTPAIPIDFVLDANPVVMALVTVVSLLLGCLAGAWLRIKLTPPEPGLAAWERVVASLLLGAAIVALVVVARVEVLAQATSFQIPLHKPASILLIAFIVALYNPADLVQYLRDKFKPRMAHPGIAPGAASGTKEGS